MSSKGIRVTFCFPLTRCLPIFLATCEWFLVTSWQPELRRGPGKESVHGGGRHLGVRHHELGRTTPRNRGVIPARRGIGRRGLNANSSLIGPIPAQCMLWSSLGKRRNVAPQMCQLLDRKVEPSTSRGLDHTPPVWPDRPMLE